MRTMLWSLTENGTPALRSIGVTTWAMLLWQKSTLSDFIGGWMFLTPLTLLVSSGVRMVFSSLTLMTLTPLVFLPCLTTLRVTWARVCVTVRLLTTRVPSSVRLTGSSFHKKDVSIARWYRIFSRKVTKRFWTGPLYSVGSIALSKGLRTSHVQLRFGVRMKLSGMETMAGSVRRSVR